MSFQNCYQTARLDSKGLLSYLPKLSEFQIDVEVEIEGGVDIGTKGSERHSGVAAQQTLCSHHPHLLPT
nr:hypothetical protein CFP56_75252 [Quercus suber]